MQIIYMDGGEGGFQQPQFLLELHFTKMEPWQKILPYIPAYSVVNTLALHFQNMNRKQNTWAQLRCNGQPFVENPDIASIALRIASPKNKYIHVLFNSPDHFLVLVQQIHFVQ